MSNYHKDEYLKGIKHIGNIHLFEYTKCQIPIKLISTILTGTCMVKLDVRKVLKKCKKSKSVCIIYKIDTMDRKEFRK